eukprot:4251219-Prymnesium_polylepis.1
MQRAFGKYCSVHNGNQAACDIAMFQRGTRDNPTGNPMHVQNPQYTTPYTYGVFVLCRWDASSSECKPVDESNTRTNFVAAPRLNPLKKIADTAVFDPEASASVWVAWDPVPATYGKRSDFDERVFRRCDDPDRYDDTNCGYDWCEVQFPPSPPTTPPPPPSP